MNYDVPGVDGPCAAHEVGQDGVGGENVHFWVGLCETANDGIVGGGDGVENPVRKKIV